MVHAVGQQFNWNSPHAWAGRNVPGRRDVHLVSNNNPLGLDPNDPASKDDMVFTGNFRVPVGRPVIEVFFQGRDPQLALPAMRIAQDAIPGSIIPMWFKPIKTGTYEIACGQLAVLATIP